MSPRLFPFLALLALPLSACSKSGPTFDVPDRQPGTRAPLTAACETMDPVRCLLPWPSSTFSTTDSTTETGIRVHLDPSSLIAPDDPTSINLADGFSRVTPLVVGFAASVADIPVSTGQGPVRLLVAQNGDPTLGTSLPLRFDVEQGEAMDGSTESFVFSYPLRPLEAASDYVGVVLDDLPLTTGPALTPSHSATVALGLVAPTTQAEAELAAYHAPTRAVLAKAGIDPEHVLMVWDFTTRSVNDPLKQLDSMRTTALAAVSSGKVTVTLTSIDTSGPAPIAAVVEGQLAGLPEYIDPVPGSALTLDAQGLPVAIGTRTAPFRAVIPVGTGNYPFVMYLHGTGGTYEDTTLDAEIAGAGAAKLAIQLDGWTASTAVETFVGLVEVFQGSEYAVANLQSALADGSAIQTVMTGALGDLISAPMLGTSTNPAAGRRPDGTKPVIWAGGSLGGITSLVAVSGDTNLTYGVLNVPGAAWTHFVPKSTIFAMIAGLLQTPYQGTLNALQAVAMSQGDWDEIDGAAWSARLAGRSTAFLIQESIDDPVVPNPGSEMVAVVTGAKQIGAVLVPIAAGIPQATQVVGAASAITQYKVISSDPLLIHGFAAQNTPAGDAARSQIAAFVQSIYAGSPTITVPAGCTGGSCDFSGQ